jgi:hypothetical protein
MALSRCGNPQCASVGRFHLMEANIGGAEYKQYFVQCSMCGTVVGVLPYYDPGITAHDNNELLKKLKEDVNGLRSDLVQVSAQIAALRR